MSRYDDSYYVTFMNDCSGCGYVYLSKHKREVLETFKTYRNKVLNQLGKTMKAIRSDRCGEYTSQEFLDMMNLTNSITVF